MRPRGAVLAVLAVLAALAVVVTGCSAGAPATAPAESGGAGFPRTVTHGQGSATIEAPPQRVVALGFADVQIASALDAPVVGGIRSTTSADGTWPGTDVPADLLTLDAVTPSLEQIAALRPDLILATTAQPAYSEVHAELSGIAPTISYRTALLEDGGDELTTLIGQALGADAEAAALIERSDAALAAFAEGHPELRGREYVFGQFVGGQFYAVVAPDAPSARFLGALGLRLPSELAALPVQQAPGVTLLAPENLDLLDTADLGFVGIYTAADSAAFAAQPLVADLAVRARGDLTELDPADLALLLAPNPATTELVLDRLAPALEAFVERER